MIPIRKQKLISGKHGLNDRQNFKWRVIFNHSYNDIISVENLLAAWQEFLKGKRKKRDVQEFQANLMDNIFDLHHELETGLYQHNSYYAFKISDPKPREIHKATVRDRLLHHALYRKMYPFFDRTWIADSFSCRNNKGTHRAMNRFRKYAKIVSKNNTRTCWILKCDIHKFFASIDQKILIDILTEYISDIKILKVLIEIIESFHSTATGKGLPLGNLTSQLLVNIYMNEFDQFAKHQLKAKYYIRYADDFVFLSENKIELERLLPHIDKFLKIRLALSLHPYKVKILTLASGVDFLGWVHFPDHRILRTATKRRMFHNSEENMNEARIISYLGLLSHGNAYKLSRLLKSKIKKRHSFLHLLFITTKMFLYKFLECGKDVNNLLLFGEKSG